ncbi:MAG: hypothetical protein ACLSGS_12965 [Adlercreutzia sp.]
MSAALTGAGTSVIVLRFGVVYSKRRRAGLPCHAARPRVRRHDPSWPWVA